MSDTATTKDSVKKDEEPLLTQVVSKLQFCVKPAIKYLQIAIPFAIYFTQQANKVYKRLAGDEVQLITGLILCFFGGVYPTLFAAIEAARHGGAHLVKSSLKALGEEALVIIEESKKDDEKDDDGDGKADIDQIIPKEYIMRKAQLVVTKINPQKVDTAIANLYTVWLSVAATLSIQFARTIALSLTIAKFGNNLADQHLQKHVLAVTPPEYHKWVPVIQGWVIKSWSMSIAWTMQTIISAATSALTGGLLAARALISILSRKGVSLNGFIPTNHEDTSKDEIMSYALAGVGFYFQFKYGFSLPFPFNFLFFPLGWAEYYIKWSITK